jgi:carboxylesterase type B
LEALGISPADLAKLHELPADRFLRPQGQVSPVLDGRSITAHPADALAAGASSTVPLVIGSNQTESTLLGHPTELGSFMTQINTTFTTSANSQYRRPTGVLLGRLFKIGGQLEF